MKPVPLRFPETARTGKSAGSNDAISETGRGMSELLISLTGRVRGASVLEGTFGSVGEYAGTGTRGVGSGGSGSK